MINADKPFRWKEDIAASVDLYNRWFIDFAPLTYRQQRALTTDEVKHSFALTRDMHELTPDVVRQHPRIVWTLRMSTAPPIARDRLIGLAGVSKGLVKSLEAGMLPPRTTVPNLLAPLERICAVIDKLLDRDIFPWLAEQTTPTETTRDRAATIVADRLCGAQADPIVRNAQEQRQLALIEQLLSGYGYRRQAPPPGEPITTMAPGTYSFRTVVVGLREDETPVNIPIDVVIQPKTPRPNRFPILIEAKSAGDFTNTNKRRKEEATKVRQLRRMHGDDLALILFLVGYFDSGYLGYEAAEGLDWVWEHRIEDLLELGIAT
jgi:hypothetical protein